ncbi:hypothetical protein EV424DRAFT_1646520 [Suillus variegatus]|nr:hypothetical protein EV424DRAFT_1646520 [Suillus variegatus]
MSVQQAFVLHTLASLNMMDRSPGKQSEQRIPFQDYGQADPALFVQRTYLHFLWLPHPHPLHAFIEPLLLSLRAAANKYHNELPRILADGGGSGEAEESMMWYVLRYEKVDGSAERNDRLTGEDNAMLEEKWRSVGSSTWSSIQILLYFFKLSLPGPCTPLPPVEVPPTDNIPFISPVKPSRLWKKKKEKPNLIIPSSIERLESFMDKLSMWQLVSLMNISRTEIATRNKNEHDWMQKFCEDVQIKALGTMCPPGPFQALPELSLLRRITFSLHGSRFHHSSSTTAAGSQSGVTTKLPARTRSLSISLAQEKEKERAASHVSYMDRERATVSQADKKMLAATAKRIIGHTDSQSQSSQSCAAPAITLVTVTPVKKSPPRAKSNVSARSSSPILIARSSSVLTTERSSSPHLTGRSSNPPIARNSSLTLLDTDDDELPCSPVPLLDFFSDSLGNVMEEDEDADGEMWLPNSSPDALLLGKSGWGISAKKRVPSAVLNSDTPLRKRLKLGR